jgi:hypothetical protein
MRSRRARWFFAVLALAVNLGGGPMAWAHLAPAAHSQETSAPAPPMNAGCHEQQTDSATSMPCCDGGACECATPPAPLAVTLDAPTDLRHDALRAPRVTRLIAPDPLDDTLRPPIR